MFKKTRFTYCEWSIKNRFHHTKKANCLPRLMLKEVLVSRVHTATRLVASVTLAAAGHSESQKSVHFASIIAHLASVSGQHEAESRVSPSAFSYRTKSNYN